jgi:hypothetical protein
VRAFAATERTRAQTNRPNRPNQPTAGPRRRQPHPHPHHRRQAAPSDRAAAARLSNLDAELGKLKGEQQAISERWRGEKDEMNKLQYLKEEIERVNLEVQQAERDYDLNRRAAVGLRCALLGAGLRAARCALRAACCGLCVCL